MFAEMFKEILGNSFLDSSHEIVTSVRDSLFYNPRLCVRIGKMMGIYASPGSRALPLLADFHPCWRATGEPNCDSHLWRRSDAPFRGRASCCRLFPASNLRSGCKRSGCKLSGRKSYNKKHDTCLRTTGCRALIRHVCTR